MVEMRFITGEKWPRSAAVALLTVGVLASAAPLLAGDPPAPGSSAVEQAAISADPPVRPQQLKLEDLPRPLGPTKALFNGRDLRGWDVWLGLPDPAKTFSATRGTPIGLNKDGSHVFSVVIEDGAPAILADGKPYGNLTSKAAFGNYHLRLEYKWGENTTASAPRNSGLLYHSRGPYGAFFSTWMSAVEFQMIPHSIGLVLAVGENAKGPSNFDINWTTRVQAPVGHDPVLPYPSRRYMPGGRLITLMPPAYVVEPASDAERPIGQWNRIDLYAVGNRSIHVVNGLPVMATESLTAIDAKDGKPRPLTRGRFQLEAEGAQIYFRDIMIEPISRLPRITVVEETGKAH